MGEVGSSLEDGSIIEEAGLVKVNKSWPDRSSYPIPRRYLFASEWEMNFWDVVWYLAAMGSGEFQVTMTEITRLMSGLPRYDRQACRVARGYFVRLRRQAVAQEELLDLTPPQATTEEWQEGEAVLRRTHRVGRESFYRLVIPNYEEQSRRGCILKPAGYVAHGWLRVVEPAIPKRVLNFFFLQPWRDDDDPARPQDAHPREHWLRKILRRAEEELGVTLRRDKVETAIDLLLGWRILREGEGEIALDRSVFARPPVEVSDLASAVAAYRAEDQERARLTERLILRGGLPAADYPRVYAALGEFDTPEMQNLLRGSVLAQRGTPVAGRWQRALKGARKMYKEKLRSQSRQREKPQRLRSNRVRVAFDLGLPQRRELQFDERVDDAVVVSARLVLRVLVADWKLRSGEVESLTLEIELRDGRGQPVPGTVLSLGVRSDWETVSRRIDFSSAAQGMPDLRRFELVVRVGRVVSWAKLHAYLELGVWPRSDKA